MSEPRTRSEFVETATDYLELCAYKWMGEEEWWTKERREKVTREVEQLADLAERVFPDLSWEERRLKWVEGELNSIWGVQPDDPRYAVLRQLTREAKGGDPAAAAALNDLVEEQGLEQTDNLL